VNNLVLQFWGLMSVLNNTPREDDGIRIWKWDSKGFSTKSYYNFLNFGGILAEYSDLWKLQIPLKVKVLCWLVLREKQKMYLLKKESRDSICELCGDKEETHAHIFLQCNLVNSILRSIKYKLGDSRQLEYMENG